MTATITRDLPPLSPEELAERIRPYATKIAFFQQWGYDPHYYQLLFHTASNPTTNLLARYRSLAAGRRGGKTLSAAEDLAYYMEFPSEFHLHAHGKVNDRPLWAYALTENYKRLLPAYRTFKEVLIKHGLKIGRDVKERVGDKMFEFRDGSVVEFRSADEPESLRGAGLDILWMDEAAFIRSPRAYEVVRPALADKQGIVINTTTPDFKNWFHDEFWDGKCLTHPGHFRVSYYSLDNPVFPVAEWEEEKARMHPMLFAVEYMASFDAMKGKALSPDWLNYYDEDAMPKGLERYIGVDPAISLNENADEFVISCIGLDPTTSQVYLIEQYAGRIPFPDQVEIINEWYMKHRPIALGVENVAYQAALAQQVLRLDAFVPMRDIEAKGKKFERIMGMSPFFKAKRIWIRRSHTDFINEWINYDPALKKPKDDCLDSVEIALRTAGVLLSPSPERAIDISDIMPPDHTPQELAARRIQRQRNPDPYRAEDEFNLSI